MNNSQSHLIFINSFIRIVLLIMIVVLALYGFRIYWFYQFDNSDKSVFLHNLIDAIAFEKDVMVDHISLGVSFAAILVFYIIFNGILFFFNLFNKTRKTSNIIRSCYKIFLSFFIFAVAISGIIQTSSFSADTDFIQAINNIHLCGSIILLVILILSPILLFFKNNEDIQAAPSGLFQRFVVIAVASVGALFCLFIIRNDIAAPYQIICEEQNRMVRVDGKESDLEWLGVDEYVIPVSHGANFKNGHSLIKLKTFHNKYYFYFLIKWLDPTPSYNKHLQKTKGGWVEVKTEPFPKFGETVYWEDMLAVSLHNYGIGCLPSCHLTSDIAPGKHSYLNQKADVWMWKCASTNPVFQAEDGWWGGETIDPVTGSKHRDNKAGGGYNSNLNKEWNQPYFLPDFAGVHNYIDLTSNLFQPYSDALDTFSLESMIPGVVVAPAMGDIADVRTYGKWRGEEWVLEISRVKSTGSDNDIILQNEIYLGLTLFDNAEKRHAFHIKPIKMVIR